MVVVEEALLSRRQQRCIDQLPAKGHHSDVLEPEEGLVSKLVVRLDLFDHDDVWTLSAWPRQAHLLTPDSLSIRMPKPPSS